MERRETDEEIAERLVTENLAKAGWAGEMLSSDDQRAVREGGDRAPLRRETAVARAWVSESLKMGRRQLWSADRQ